MDDKDLQLVINGMEHIGKAVDKIDGDMETVKAELVRNEEWHKVLNEKVKDIHVAVHGNGKAGLSQEIKCIDDAVGINSNKISVLSAKIDDLQKSHDEEAKDRKDWTLGWLKHWRTLLFAGMTALITLVVSTAVDYVISAVFHP